MDAELDRVPVNQLEQRYSIPRSVLYDRMKALGIKATKIGNKSYLSDEQLRLLDDLDEHMQAGGSVAMFVDKVGKQGDLVVAGQSTGQIEMLARAIAAMNQQPQIDPWDKHEQLDRIAAKGWLISTSQLLPLLGLASVPKLDAHNRFGRMGFVFSRCGKAGREYEWEITKQV